MKYLLRNLDNGKFVSRPGSYYSYTKNVMEARVFTADEIQREKCGNEIAIPVETLLERFR